MNIQNIYKVILSLLDTVLPTVNLILCYSFVYDFHNFKEFNLLIIDRWFDLLKGQRFNFFDTSSKCICIIAYAVSDKDTVTRAKILHSILVTEAESIKVYQFCKILNRIQKGEDE